MEVQTNAGKVSLLSGVSHQSLSGETSMYSNEVVVSTPKKIYAMLGTCAYA